jgi:hypothetical protein
VKKADIAKKFYRSNRHPKAVNVGKLIKILQELPPPPTLRLGTKVEVKVWNMSIPSPFCSVEELD